MAVFHRAAGVVLGLVALLASPPAVAHPHIFVDATAAVEFDAAGRVVAIHNRWTFDAAYSAWSVQGLDLDNDGQLTPAELQPLADDNMDGLAEYSYYTFLGEGQDPNLPLAHGARARLDMADGRTTLDFEVPLVTPYAIRAALELSIADPEYYVAITFAGENAVTLVNAPANCRARIAPARDLPPALADALYALPPDVTRLPDNLAQALRGMQGSIVIDCPGGSATGAAPPASTAVVPSETAADAAKTLADRAEDPAGTGNPLLAGNVPFGAVPNEPALALPRTGFFGWVQDVQRDVYRDLEQALTAIKSNGNAFWVLGLLSFLYGIFHAAGPGHGKVVISSYVLANEAQLRRGILLSFLAAMLQSAVAIVFVLVAALLLGLTAMAMSDVAEKIGLVSYGLIALLGLWLIARKLFGFGHSHAHDHPKDRLPATPSRQEIARRHLGATAHALSVAGPPLARFSPASGAPDAYGRAPGHPHFGHDHADDDHHDHVHAITPAALRGNWREQASIVFAVGMRPCAGALIVLAFALSQGLVAAGIAAVLLMGLGTAITTGLLAAAAIGMKSLARIVSGADNPLTARLVWWAELLAAIGVFAFGAVLVLAGL